MSDLYRLREYVSEAVVPAGSPWVGRTLRELRAGADLDISVLGRVEPGAVRRLGANAVLAAGDRRSAPGAIDWGVLVLVASLLVLATAMDASGAGRYLAAQLAGAARLLRRHRRRIGLPAPGTRAARTARAVVVARRCNSLHTPWTPPPTTTPVRPR